MTRRAPIAAVLLAPLLATVACGGNGDEADRPTTTLTVFAAASLSETFTEIADDFEATHPDVDVRLSFGGSSDLVAQIQGGAPADVFASADTANMDKLVADHLLGNQAQPFATNTLEIVTPPDNPAQVETLADLADADVTLVTCAPEVPCGAAAQKVADVAGLTFEPVSEEQSVTDVLTKVESGEADAGLVYVTDVLAAGDAVHGVEFAESRRVVNVYPIATVQDSAHAELAQQFVDAVMSDEGQAVLRRAGFGAPR